MKDLIKNVTHELRQDSINLSAIFGLVRKHELSENKPNSDLTIFLLLACDTFETTIDLVLSRTREDPTRYVRAFYCKYIMSLGTYSDFQVGKRIHRHRTTVLNAVHTANDLIDTDKEYKRKWELYLSKIEDLNKEAARKQNSNPA